MTTEIHTPRGSITQGPNGRAELVWDTKFVDKLTKTFSEVQKFIDREVLRGCEPYVPFRTGMLVMSGVLGTTIGSGKVSYIAPYARARYYHPGKIGSQTGPLRGPFWFARWKAVSGKALVDQARKMAAK
jgi:hypothetical protein